MSSSVLDLSMLLCEQSRERVLTLDGMGKLGTEYGIPEGNAAGIPLTKSGRTTTRATVEEVICENILRRVL